MDLKDWLKEKGWSITEFAKRIGISRATVYLWINKKKPSKYAVKRIHEITDGKVTSNDWDQRKI